MYLREMGGKGRGRQEEGEKRGTGRERGERKTHIAFSDIKASIWS